MKAVVSVVMGSKSDWNTMKNTTHILAKFNINYEVEIVSAHRTPDKMFSYAKEIEKRGIKVIIAGAGGAAHLPGMIAAITTLPVLGVPICSKALNGKDSLLSIVQMPKGVAVGTLAIGDSGAINAGILAAQILALMDKNIKLKLLDFRKKQTEEVLKHSNPEE